MNDKDIVIIKKQDDGKEIEIKHGDALQIELEEMGSTGYKWHVNTIDVEHVELITEKTVALREGVIGGPILHVWRFKVLKKGHADIKIDYYREWEGIEKAKDHFFIKLTIQ